MGMSGGLFFLGFGFFFEPLRQHFNWSRTLLSGAFALTRVESGVFGPLEGYLINRFGPRRVMIVSFILFGAGFALLSLVNSVLTFYLAFVVMAIGAGTAGFPGVMAALANWFRRYRARAFGLSFLGMGLGGVVFPPLLALGIEQYDWRTMAWVCGLFVAVVGIPLSLVVRYKPEPYGYLPDGDAPGSLEAAGEPEKQDEPGRDNRVPGTEYDFTVREALSTWAFWLLSIAHGLSLMVVSVVTLHQVPYLEADLGFSKGSAAVVVMVMTGVSMFGQVAGGVLGDRFPKQIIGALTILGHAGGLVLLATADTYGQVLVSAVVQGLAWGFRTPVLLAMRGEFFGRESFAVIMGFSQAIMMIGMIAGPLLAGYFADNYSYSLGFKLVAAIVLPGFFMLIFLKKPQPKPKSA
jgi:MFS family permease